MLTKQAVEYIKLGSGGSYSLSRDAIKHQIWDTRVFGTAISDFTYFSQPMGAPWRVGVKSVNEINITTAGQLPNGQTMLLTRFGVCLIVPIASTETDVPDIAQAFTNIMQSSVFEIRIAGRDYDFQCHGSQFMSRPIALNGDGTTYQHRVGDMIASGWLKLDPAPVFVDQLVNFSVVQRLNNPDPGVVAILNANATLLDGLYGSMQVTLEGFLTRAK